VGHGGLILHTEDAGRTWQQQSSGTETDLDSVAFNSPKSGWATGYANWHHVVLHTEDGGLSWHEKVIGNSKEQFGDIYFNTPTSGWIILLEEHDAGSVLHTEDGGLTWQKQKTGTDEKVTFIVFGTATLGVAVGRFGTILITEDGGLTWQERDSGTEEDWLHAGAFSNP
jgi:photosystem II stability/assembly factor-like uncharacterized protein